jgi:hypothetical protein
MRSAEPQFGAEEAAKRAQMEAAIARIEAEQQHYRNVAIWPSDVAATVALGLFIERHVDIDGIDRGANNNTGDLNV